MNTKATVSHLGKPVVIVEIGADWLKLVQAEPYRDGIAISKMHLEKFDTPGTALSGSVSSAFKKLKFARTPVIACLPRQMANIRMLELPSTDPAEIADMVDLQVGKQTPYSKEEIVSDYRIVGSGREGYTRVMLAIVQRSIVSQRFHILEEAGVEVERMSVSSEGILNWYGHAVLDQGGGAGDRPRVHEGDAVVLLDIDSFYSDFAVIANGDVVFTRSILAGANQLLNEYEKRKEKFAKEVRRSLEICRGESPGLNVGRLFITGAGPNIGGISDYLAGQLNFPGEVRDCLEVVRKMPETPSMRDPEYRPVSLTPLVGIALAPGNLEFNLIPDSVRLKQWLAAKAKSLTVLGVLLMTVFVSVSMYATLKFCFRQDRRDALYRELLAIEPVAAKVTGMHDIIKVVKNRRNPRFATISILSEVHRLVPEGVYFEVIDIDVEKEQVLLEGFGRSRKDIRSLVNNLEQSPFFEDAKEGGATRRDKSGRFRFQVVCVQETAK